MSAQAVGRQRPSAVGGTDPGTTNVAEVKEGRLRMKVRPAAVQPDCCTFLGRRDGWAGRRQRMTFIDRAELDGLLGGLLPVALTEQAYDGTDARGAPKRWPVFRCILRKVRARPQV